MNKAIYIYTDGKNFKIGKADQRSDQSDSITIDEICDTRIREQQTASTYGELKPIKFFNISTADSSVMVESYIHNQLEVNGYDRLKRKYKDHTGNTEWFNLEDLNEGQVIELVGNLIKDITGSTGKNQFSPYFYQAYVKGLLLDQVDSGTKVIAAELAPRFGKTPWSLDTFKDLNTYFNYQYLILPSYILTAHASFLKELRSYSDFDDMMFISDNDSDFIDKVRNNKDKKLVIAVSLHTPEDKLSKYDCIKELDNDKKVAFIDEADFGAHTGSSKKIINLLECDLKVLITGTAIERAVAGYNVSDIIRWSYSDMLLLQDGTHPLLENLATQD
jgi:hypothetical protein|tara:strand:- start:2779 stop:3774 length:996 start_codon:yes stop_codon:yes gene_type:complete